MRNVAAPWRHRYGSSGDRPWGRSRCENAHTEHEAESDPGLRQRDDGIAIAASAGAATRVVLEDVELGGIRAGRITQHVARRPRRPVARLAHDLDRARGLDTVLARDHCDRGRGRRAIREQARVGAEWRTRRRAARLDRDRRRAKRCGSSAAMPSAPGLPRLDPPEPAVPVVNVVEGSTVELPPVRWRMPIEFPPGPPPPCPPRPPPPPMPPSPPRFAAPD